MGTGGEEEKEVESNQDNFCLVVHSPSAATLMEFSVFHRDYSLGSRTTSGVRVRKQTHSGGTRAQGKLHRPSLICGKHFQLLMHFKNC